MSLEETRSLLRVHQIAPNKLLGQNFMVDSSFYPKLSSYAALSAKDVVLDVGAGFGFLSLFLSPNCKQVIAVEKDPRVAEILRQQTKGFANITLIVGDVLKVDVPRFNKVISIPPYYLSSQLVMWLLDRDLECAVLILQKEFAERLSASLGCKEYGWIAVVAQQAMKMELLDTLPKWLFYPPPEVDSIIIRVRPLATPEFSVNNIALFRRMVKWLFAQRNKKIGNAIKNFIRCELEMDKIKAAEVASSLPFRDRRARELDPKEFGAIADAISK